MSVFLLDINVLIALTDPMHVHHELAHRWFSETGQEAWATCPLTQNGFIRIASHPNFPNRPGDLPAVIFVLHQLCETPGHHFWPDDIGILDMLQPDAIVTHAQITDIYLLGLAVHKNGKLATLDHRIPAEAVPGGMDALERIGA